MVLIRRDEGYWRKYVTVARTGLIIVGGLALLAALISIAPYVANNPSSYAGANQQVSGGSINDNLSVLAIIGSGSIAFGRWAGFHHNAIEAFSALGGLLFSGVLTVSTIYLWRETRKAAEAGAKQAKLTRKSIKLARQEFIATHRPRLRVRNFDLTEMRQRGGPNIPGISNGYPIRGQLYVTNIGDSDAFITETWAKAYCLEGPLPMRRPYEGQYGIPWASESPIVAGSSIPLPFASSPYVMGPEVYDIIRGVGPYTVFVMGYIAYKDGANRPRRTAFCRRYDADSKCFVDVKNPDYTHEE